MITSRIAPNALDRLVNFMFALGFPMDVNHDGPCLGMSVSAARAIVSKETKTFEERILRIQSAIEGDPSVLTPEFSHEIHAFFGGVMLIQFPERFEEWFTPGPLHQLRMAGLPFIASMAIEQKKGMKLVATFTGAYRPHEMLKNFQALEHILQQYTMGDVFTLLIRTEIHCVTIAYENGTWLLFNINKLFDPLRERKAIQRFDNVENFVTALVESINFGEKEHHAYIFSTTVVATGESKQQMKSILSQWQQQETYQELHKVTYERVHLQDKNAATWLLVAAIHGNVDEVRALRAKDANVDIAKTRMSDGASPLFLAVVQGHYAVIDVILEDLSPEEKSFVVNQERRLDEKTPLMVAAQQGEVAIIHLLIFHGAKINLKSKEDATALNLATICNQKQAVSALLQYESTDIDMPMDDNASPLFHAVLNGNVDIVILLLTKHPAVDKCRDSDSMTPLMVAAQFGFADIIKLLLAAGSNANEKRKTDGATALYLACSCNKIEAVRALLTYPDIDVYSARHTDQLTPMKIVKWKKHQDILNLLLEHVRVNSELTNNAVIRQTI